MELSSISFPLASSHRTCMVWCCMYSLRLPMMDGKTSETCRLLLQNKINLRYCASSWFYYRNILRCTVLQTSDFHEIACWRLMSKFAGKFQFWILLAPLRLWSHVDLMSRNVSNKCCVEKWNRYFVLSTFVTEVSLFPIFYSIFPVLWQLSPSSGTPTPFLSV